MEAEQTSIELLSNDPSNVRVHSQRNIEAIKASLRRFGQQKPIVIDGNGVVRAGNGTLEAARQLGWKEIAAVTTELTGSDAVAYAIADNRTAELAEWDDEALMEQLESLGELDESLRDACGFTQKDVDALAAVCEEVGDDRYTRKIESPCYEPSGECPELSQLLDAEKHDSLVAEIEAAEIPEDVRKFLIVAASRHVVFDYGKVADFYAHASPTVQRLMESSALIVVDFGQAIEGGYTHLSDRLADLFQQDSNGDGNE